MLLADYRLVKVERLRADNPKVRGKRDDPELQAHAL
jgi:hypothetical protein